VSPEDGIVLGGETSAFPITGGISLFPQSDPISQRAFKDICQIEDWRDGKFRVNVGALGNTLMLTGAGRRRPEKNLPPIGYQFDVRMGNTKLAQSRFEFRLREGGTLEIPIRIREPKRVRFVEAAKYDAETRAIVTSPESSLDGKGAVEWLAAPTVRTARKLCMLNCLAFLRTLPSVRDTLSSHVQSVQFADIDRIAVRVGDGFLDRMREIDAFKEDSGPLHPTHLRTRDRLAGAAAPAYKLHSFRQQVSRFSMQIIVGQPAGDITLRPYAEIDIDLGNPFVDAVGFGTHLFELLDPSATDHFDLASQAPLDFRYYSFAEGAQG
jgi:hypothetical protein